MYKKVTIIIPTLDEKGICKSLAKLTSFLRYYNYEIIIVDDSIDENFKVIQNFIKFSNFENIKLFKGRNKGKGDAIRLGAFKANGDIIFYMDADLTIPLDNIHKFINIIENEDCDMIIAERPLARYADMPLRYILALGLYITQRYFVLFLKDFHDTQCGFKAFDRKSLKNIINKQTIVGGMFDIEYIYIALKNKLRIKKYRVNNLPEVRKSKIKLIRCLFLNPLDLLKIKLNGLLRKYHF